MGTQMGTQMGKQMDTQMVIPMDTIEVSQKEKDFNFFVLRSSYIHVYLKLNKPGCKADIRLVS